VFPATAVGCNARPSAKLAPTMHSPRTRVFGTRIAFGWRESAAAGSEQKAVRRALTRLERNAMQAELAQAIAAQAKIERAATHHHSAGR
jgi:hypothetical protein